MSGSQMLKKSPALSIKQYYDMEILKTEDQDTCSKTSAVTILKWYVQAIVTFYVDLVAFDAISVDPLLYFSLFTN